MKIAKVYVEYSALKINRPFYYLVGEGQKLEKGERVVVPFSHKNIVGYVSEVLETSKSLKEINDEFGYELKTIIKVIDEKPIINDEIEELVDFLEKETLAPRIACYQSVLPPSLKPTSSKAKASILKTRYYKVIKEDETLNKTQKEIVDFIKDRGEVSVDDLPFSAARLRTLVDKGVLKIIFKERYRELVKETEKKPWPKLTKDQQKALDTINNSAQNIVLLEGVTGSGKTELYLRLTRECLDRGQRVLVLVPEIALTPLIVQRFKERFEEGIAVFHSGLSISEKYDEYRRILRGEVSIVIGTRSAAFVPLENIGLFIMDEEHSESYKQDVSPSYHARDIIAYRSKDKTRVVLGSATPSLESKVRAVKGVYGYASLPNRINNKELPNTVVVDMNDELRSGNYSLFSSLLKEKIADRLAKNEQVILLLNRRGFASFVSCRSCHHVFKCPTCDVSLTYHKSEGLLKCHYCGYTEALPRRCPKCGNSSISYIGLGTQKIEEEIHKLFPSARVVRMDYDTTSRKNSLEKILKDFDNHEYDILLGTQMISKGLDFPLVTLVGVINADIGLYLADFRAAERTYQLLTQVIGRSGRENKTGEALIQTYNASNYVLEEARKQDYESFFMQEVSYRKFRNYPPFHIFTNLLFKGTSYEETFTIAENVKKYMMKADPSLIIFGPVAPYIAKEGKLFKVKLTLKYKDKQKTLGLLKDVIESIMNNTKVSLHVIVDPYTD